MQVFLCFCEQNKYYCMNLNICKKCGNMNIYTSAKNGYKNFEATDVQIRHNVA